MTVTVYPSVYISRKRILFETDGLISMKLYTDVVYIISMCIKTDNPLRQLSREIIYLCRMRFCIMVWSEVY